MTNQEADLRFDKIMHWQVPEGSKCDKTPRHLFLEAERAGPGIDILSDCGQPMIDNISWSDWQHMLGHDSTLSSLSIDWDSVRTAPVELVSQFT